MQSKNIIPAVGLLALSSVVSLGQPALAAPPRVKVRPPVKSVKSIKVARAVVPQPKGPRRISLDFVGADINDVIKALALQAGENIVTAADVKGNVTVSLNRVTVAEALDMVARLSGYQYAKVGPAYIVGTDKSVAALSAGPTAPPEVPVPAVTEFIPVRFARVADLDKTLGDRYPELQRSVSGDDKAAPSSPRMLVLTGQAGRVAEAREFVGKLEQAIQFPTQGVFTEVYRVQYASPSDLLAILSRLVPTVQVTLGPSQGFQSGSTGASAAFASSPSGGNGGGAAAGGGAPAGGGGGTANPAGAVASGNAPSTLLLSGSPADIGRAKEVLTQIDVRVPQISFEARVVDIGSTDFSRIGLTYDFSSGVRLGESDTAGPGSIQGTGARKPNFGAIFRTPYSIGMNLDLLQQNGQAKLLARPNISALDGQPAVVFIGDQIKYIINREVTPTGTNIQTETATVGITLKVTGKSSPDGNITLYVHPEVSVISGFLNVEGGISLPQIATRFVDTTVRVKDGETFGIGGLIREQDITNLQKVPFLGDLPIIGQLFRRKEKNNSRSEIMVFITCRIVKD